MVSERKYKKAQQIVNEYEKQLSQSVIDSYDSEIEYSTLLEVINSLRLKVFYDDKTYYLYENSKHKYVAFVNEIEGAKLVLAISNPQNLINIENSD